MQDCNKIVKVVLKICCCLTILTLSFSNWLFSQRYYPITENGRWSIIDEKGNQLLETDFSYVSHFKNGYAAVKKDGVWGIISLDGFEKYFPNYDEIKPIRHQNGNDRVFFAARKFGGDFALIDKDNTLYSRYAFANFEVHANYYVGEKSRNSLELGKLNDTSYTIANYKEIKFENCYFITTNQKGKKTLFNLDQDTLIHNFTKIQYLAGCIIAFKKNSASILSCSGEIIAENASEIDFLNESSITGYDKQLEKYFTVKSNQGQLKIEYQKLEAKWLSYSIFIDSNNFLKIEGENNSLQNTQYKHYNRQLRFLLLAKDELDYSVYNKQLQLIVENGVDFVGVTENENWFLFRQNELYGLITEDKILVPAQYNFIKIQNDRVHAYSENSMTLFTVNNNHFVTEKEKFDNFISVNSFSELDPLLSEDSDIDVGDISEERNAWFSKLIPVGDSTNKIERWGFRNPADTNEVYVEPKYLNIRTFNDRFDRCIIRKGKKDNLIHYNHTFDIYDSEKNKIVTERPLYNIKKHVKREQKLYLAKNRGEYYLYNDTFKLSHKDIAYLENSWHSKVYRYCTSGNGQVKFKQNEQAERAIPVSKWVNSFVNFNWNSLNLNAKEIYEYRDLMNNYYTYFQNAKWGYIDPKGNKVFDEEFDYIDPLMGNIAFAYKNDMKGVVNDTGILIPPIYPSLKLIKFEDDTLIKVATSKGKSKEWINKYGDLIDLPHHILEKSRLNDRKEVITFKKNRKFGLLDLKGNIIYDAKSTIEPIVKDQYVIIKERKYGIIDFDGTHLVEPELPRILQYKNGLVLFKTKGKMGVTNEYGNEIIPAAYKEIKIKNNTIQASHRKNWETFNLKGDKLGKSKWYDTDYHPNKKMWTYAKKGKSFLYDEANKKKTKLKLGKSTPKFCGGFLRVEHKTNSINLYTTAKDPKKVFSSDYTEIEHYKEGLYKIYEARKFGLANKNGVIILEPNYRKIVEVFEGVYAGKYKHRILAVNKYGDTLYNENCHEFEKCSNGYLSIKNERGVCYLDSNFNNVFGTYFSDAKCFSFGVAPIKVDGFWTLINEDNEKLFEPCYKNLSLFFNNKFLAESKAIYGVYNKHGEIIAEPKYERIYKIDDNTLKVLNGGEIGYINKNGKWIKSIH